MVRAWPKRGVVVSSDQLRAPLHSGLVEMLSLLLDLRVVSSRAWSFELRPHQRLSFLLREGKLLVLEAASATSAHETTVHNII